MWVNTFGFRAVCRIFHILSKTHQLSQHGFRIHILWNGMSYKKSLFYGITFLVFKGEVCKNDKGLELNGSVIHNEYLLLWFPCQISTLHGVMVNIYTIMYIFLSYLECDTAKIGIAFHIAVKIWYIQWKCRLAWDEWCFTCYEIQFENIVCQMTV